MKADLHTMTEPITFTIPALVPCPFCGSAPITRYVKGSDTPLRIECPSVDHNVYVECPVIGFKDNGYGVYEPPDLDDLMRCVRIVANRWNKRFAES